VKRHGKLTRVCCSNLSSKMRTQSIEGYYGSSPSKGECFLLIGDSIDIPGAARLVETSKVIRVVGKTFFTEDGSEYELESN